MRQRISINSRILFGKPCVVGTRISVVEVMELVNDGIAVEEIRREYYSVLTVEDINACVQFSTDVIPAKIHT